MQKSSQTGTDQSLDESLRSLFIRVDKIEKEIVMMRNSNNLNDVSYLHSNGDGSKSHISAYKVNQ